MIKIAPSILSANFATLGEDIDAISTADMVHFDVMDGNFVPNISVGLPVLQSVRKHTDMMLDVHLMIDKPKRYIQDFVKAGADMITVHLEADHPTGIADAIAQMKTHKVKCGVALRPITKAEAIIPYLRDLNMVLVMTVEPGFGGQAFMEDQLETIAKVSELIREHNPNCLLEVDGGIDLTTAPKVIQAGANVLVAGSAIYGKPDRAEMIAKLRACQ